MAANLKAQCLWALLREQECTKVLSVLPLEGAVCHVHAMAVDTGDGSQSSPSLERSIALGSKRWPVFAATTCCLPTVAQLPFCQRSIVT